jgi:hypothetical protein
MYLDVKAPELLAAALVKLLLGKQFNSTAGVVIMKLT